MINLSPDALITALIGLAIIVGVGLAVEPWLAPALLRMRAKRLPADLAERFAEEWLAECAALDTRHARLVFAISLFVTSTRRLLGEGEPALTHPWRGLETLLSTDVQVTADLWSRAPALLLDTLVAAPIIVLLVRWLPLTSGRHVLLGSAITMARVAVMDVLLVRYFGGSPGKLLMKLRIVSVDGAPIGYRQALLRVAPNAALSVATALLFAWALTGPVPVWIRWPVTSIREVWSIGDLLVYSMSVDRRAWHDLIAGTMVIYRVPKVVGTIDLTPRSTSAMR